MYKHNMQLFLGIALAFKDKLIKIDFTPTKQVVKLQISDLSCVIQDIVMMRNIKVVIFLVVHI